MLRSNPRLRHPQRVLLVLASMLLQPAATWPATPDDAARTDDLISHLARPAPASIAFSEVRLSALLQKPLIVSGELAYNGADNLDRRVTQPYREQTSIRGESVRVEREGEPVRSFALKRAPELRGLLEGFSALLAGDAARLRKSFTIESSITDDHWTITMTPVDARARKRVRQLIAVGHNNEPRCFTLATADGGSSIMLLGAAASVPVPALATLEQLNTLCRTPSP